MVCTSSRVMTVTFCCSFITICLRKESHLPTQILKIGFEHPSWQSLRQCLLLHLDSLQCYFLVSISFWIVILCNLLYLSELFVWISRLSNVRPSVNKNSVESTDFQIVKIRPLKIYNQFRETTTTTMITKNCSTVWFVKLDVFEFGFDRIEQKKRVKWPSWVSNSLIFVMQFFCFLMISNFKWIEINIS